ncbi:MULTISPECIES: hypothetical protein [Pseudomonas aeruginosa group]|uniref:hypothetical protein n=1 Tax=Pseudomonas aeruginosa group TaxID=136841 RepID=UPI00053DDF19|nr:MULTISPECIES: hypothetical protein [Pseudomonas aeruginosa group]MBX6310949.1 hypothetical protein [Pseudomonas aeruginosa]NMZ77536.1 hypothetical protein [Pseudomonas nitroreducens]HBO4228101.1 hypothetical protein [Pseudomonas aeruginosa]HBO4228367.1 hypothetical protein [Pseudomonas aeruginosa]
MQPNYPKFEPGQEVRSVFGGERLVVASQLGCQVFIQGRSDWFHPTKLIPVEKPTSERPACN